jgi:hypothetical protein
MKCDHKKAQNPVFVTIYEYTMSLWRTVGSFLDIKRKLRKLLTLGSQPETPETLQALTIAKKLAEKHHIDLDTIRKELDHCKRGVWITEFKTLSQDLHLICQILDTYFGVRCVMTTTTQGTINICVAGTESKIERAYLAYTFLVEEIAQIWHRVQDLEWDSFILGFGTVLLLRLNKYAPIPEEEALVEVDPDLTEFVDENFTINTSPPVELSHDEESYQCGREQARRFDLNAFM